MVTLRRTIDASQFAGVLYAVWSFPMLLSPWHREERLLRYYAVRALAFRILYNRPLNVAIMQEVKVAKTRHGANLPFGYPGPLYPYSFHHLESMLLLRLKRAKRFFSRFERTIRWWHRKFG